MRVIFNTDDFFKGMEQVESKATNSAKMAIEEVSEDLLSKSLQVVPLDKGTLRNSGGVKHFGDYSLVFYGGKASAYAVYQHEGARKGGSHQIKKHTTAGTTTKYLERPLMENLPNYQKVYGNVFAKGIAL